MNRVQRHALMSTQPWREYFPYRPDDMPPKRGNPAALVKLLKEFSENDDEGENNERLY